MTSLYTPWAKDEVDSLNERQKSPVHPYTCGNDSEHAVLVATTNGWICTDCNYTQDWAHIEDTDWTWLGW